MIKLREHQEKSIFDIKKLFSENYNFIVDGTFMGGGKTFIIAEITKYYTQEKNKKVIILLTMVELISQLEEIFKQYNIEYEVIHRNRKIKNENSKIWIVMEQSYTEEKRKKYNLNCDILIKDEFHIGYIENKGKRYTTLVKLFKPKHILGLSGTPYDKKGYLLKGLNYKNLLLHGNAKELTDKGYLVPLRYYVTKWSEEISYKDVKIVNNDYSVKMLNKKLNNKKYLNLVVEAMNKMNGKNKKVLVYVTTIQHAEELNKALVINGYKSETVHSNKKNSLNKEIIEKFNNSNEINCLVSVGKLTTGFNSVVANLLVNCRPTKILSLYLQIIFRVARSAPNKEYAEILDLAQGVSEHGFGTDFRNIKEKKVENKNREKCVKRILQKIDDNNKPVLINLQSINNSLSEIKREELEFNDIKTEELIKEFKLSNDKNRLINLSIELAKRLKRIKYNSKDIKLLKRKFNNYYKRINYKSNNELIHLFKEKLKFFLANLKN